MTSGEKALKAFRWTAAGLLLLSDITLSPYLGGAALLLLTVSTIEGAAALTAQDVLAWRIPGIDR